MSRQYYPKGSVQTIEEFMDGFDEYTLNGEAMFFIANAADGEITALCIDHTMIVVKEDNGYILGNFLFPLVNLSIYNIGCFTNEDAFFFHNIHHAEQFIKERTSMVWRDILDEELKTPRYWINKNK